MANERTWHELSTSNKLRSIWPNIEPWYISLRYSCQEVALCTSHAKIFHSHVLSKSNLSTFDRCSILFRDILVDRSKLNSFRFRICLSTSFATILKDNKQKIQLLLRFLKLTNIINTIQDLFIRASGQCCSTCYVNWIKVKQNEKS